MNPAYSSLVTGARAMRKEETSTGCAHFSLSNTNGSSALAPRSRRAPSTSTSPGSGPALLSGATRAIAGSGRDRRGVIERVHPRDRRRPAASVAQDPELLVPGDVTHLPENRVHDLEAGAHPAGIVEVD